VLDLARVFAARIGVAGRLTLFTSELRNHFCSVGRNAFLRAQLIVRSRSFSTTTALVRGFATQVVNANLFSFQQLETLTQHEDIGALIARAVVVNPSINFNIGALILNGSTP
ncbi:MAG: hypothetical protein GXP31_12730, partial [Kiritimatiellaeota bacterium]|nr:hypothetical protein [Kiritimatiellota bacterium]